MTEIMRELYYMIDEWAGQHYENDERTKNLEEQKSALEQEIARCIGEGGQEMLEALANLNLELSDIHDNALFRAALSLGVKVARPGRGA